MVTILMLALAFTAQNSAERHVRTTDARILTLIDAGLSRSATFRSLVSALNESDVIVYVDPKRTHEALGGYLPHKAVARGGYRYLHIFMETQGSEDRLLPLLAHELQHAIEIAQSPDAVDGPTVERAVARIALPFGCGGGSCYETQGALDVEHAVTVQLKARADSAPRTSAAR